MYDRRASPCDGGVSIGQLALERSEGRLQQLEQVRRALLREPVQEEHTDVSVLQMQRQPKLV